MESVKVESFKSSYDLHRFYYEELGWCGCGQPFSVIDDLHKTLRLIKERTKALLETPGYKRWKQSQDALDDFLRVSKDDGATTGWVWLYLLDDLELTEHGGNVTGSWLTDRGQDLLEALDTWPDFDEWECEEPISEECGNRE